VLRNWHKDFSSHVTAFLRPWSLVLNVNASCPRLDEQLRQFHDGCKTSMTGIRIRNQGAQEIGIGELATLGFWCAKTLFALLTVVEKLREPEVLNLVRDSSLTRLACESTPLDVQPPYHRIIRKIWTWLICRGGS
jgi:hypothetical protein